MAEEVAKLLKLRPPPHRMLLHRLQILQLPAILQRLPAKGGRAAAKRVSQSPAKRKPRTRAPRQSNPTRVCLRQVMRILQNLPIPR